MKVVAAVVALLAGCALAQLNADLTIEVPGRYLLDESISTVLEGGGQLSELCAPRVRFLEDTTNTPELDSLSDIPYQLYPPSSVVVGIQCQAVGDDALVVFVNGQDATSLPQELTSGLAPILTNPDLSEIITQLTQLPENAVFVFLRSAVCGGRAPTIDQGTPAGIMFRAVADQTLLGQQLTEGTRYFHYIVISSSGTAQVLCSYAEATSPTASPSSGGPSGSPSPSSPGGSSATPIPTPSGGASGSPSPSSPAGSATPIPTPSGGASGSPSPATSATTPTPASTTTTPTPGSSGSPSPATSTTTPTPASTTTTPTPASTTTTPTPASTTTTPTPGSSGSPAPTTTSPTATTTATATPTPTPCFPGSSTVELETGEHIAMNALEVGQRVRVSGDEFSDVFFFGHKVAEEVVDYVKVTTEAGNALWIAPNHYMYANSQMVAAGAINVGDSVELGSGDVTQVVSVEVEKRAGLYAPHTMHGDIVVDGVRASTYTQVVHPTAAKMLLWPLKVLYRLRLPAVRVLERASRGKLARTICLPKGPLVL